tara:strand:- start:874 stop:1302 length:429 start_codon:yes stop_codon:yes gene_type:complete
MELENIINSFRKEFSFIESELIIIKIFEGKGKMTDDYIRKLKRPSDDYNFIAAPGAYLFYGHGKPYRVGRHLTNTRFRVLEHLKACTNNGKESIWSIKDAVDREIVLFNFKSHKLSHWAAAAEIYLENLLREELIIPSKRLG